MSDLGLSRMRERKTKKLTTKRKSFTFRIYFLGSVTDMVDVQRTSLMEGSLPVFSASSFGSSFLILPMSAFRSFALSPFRFLPPAFLSSHFLCAFHSLFSFFRLFFFLLLHSKLSSFQNLSFALTSFHLFPSCFHFIFPFSIFRFFIFLFFIFPSLIF